jgi:predicted RNA-binding protein YlxR (DUF448 family)
MTEAWHRSRRAAASNVASTPEPVPTSTSTTGPVRTCVGCRCAVPVDELVRATFGGGRLSWSAVRRLGSGGRGASIHPREACVRAAVKNHGFARAFRAPVPGMGIDDVAAIVAEITVAYALQLRRMGRNS